MAHVTLLTFDASAFLLPTSNAPALDVVQERPFLAFDDDEVQTARTRAATMPGQFSGGTLKASVGYIMASATSGKVDFEVSVEAVTGGDSVDLDDTESFGTPNAADAAVPGTAGHLGVLTITLSNDDDVAAGDMVRFKLQRDADDATNDTATGDARVLWMEIWEETT